MVRLLPGVLIPINTEFSVLHRQSHTSFSKQCRYRWEAANKERVKSLRSFKIVFLNYLLVNKLFCSKNKKKIVPDQTAFNFLYISLHATYLVIFCRLLTPFKINIFKKFQEKNQGVKLYGSRSGPNILLVLIWLQTVHKCYQHMTKVCWSVVSKNGIYLGSAGQRLIWYLCKCIYYNIVTLFISTSIHFYFTLLVGNYLGIMMICCLF